MCFVIRIIDKRPQRLADPKTCKRYSKTEFAEFESNELPSKRARYDYTMVHASMR